MGAVQKKFVVFLRERKQGAGHWHPLWFIAVLLGSFHSQLGGANPELNSNLAVDICDGLALCGLLNVLAPVPHYGIHLEGTDLDIMDAEPTAVSGLHVEIAKRLLPPRFILRLLFLAQDRC